MKKIKTETLKPGMIFDKPIFLDSENILVPPGLPVKEKDLDRLTKWGITEVFCDGKLFDGKTGGASSQIPLDGIVESEEDRMVLKHYLKTITTMEKLFQLVRNNSYIEKADFDSAVQPLIASLKDDPRRILSFLIQNSAQGFSLAHSAVNCMVLAHEIGHQMVLPHHRHMEVTIGALLHDIGMLKIPSEIINKKGNLIESELSTVQTHTRISYQIITKQLKYSEEIGVIALQHHERWDGKGYPNGLKEKNIELSARIVSVADAFDAMLKSRPYRNPMIGYAAIKQILNDSSRKFDPEILKVFVRSMGIYPLGSIVILNNGLIARVVKIHNGAPLRPGITVLMNDKGKKVKEPEYVDLMKEKGLFILRALDPAAI